MSIKHYIKKRIDSTDKIFSAHKRKLLIIFILIFSFLILSFLQQTQVLPQKSISILQDIDIPQKNDKVIFVIPHADDETLASGGLIQRAIKNQADVYIILVTDSNHRGLKNKRYLEFFNVINNYKINDKKVFLLNLPDGKLSIIGRDVIEKDLINIFFGIRPNYIIYPSVFDHHIDHKIIGEVVLNIINRQTNIKSYSYLVHYKYYPRPMKYSKNSYLMPPLALISFN
jgi:LmbE family N-acetylglucosaminyl deacetylase